MIAQKTQKSKITELQIGEVKMEIIYFVSANGSVDANGILQQYVGEEDKRKPLKSVDGKDLLLYQITRDKMFEIKANRNLKDVVKFYSQYLEQPLKELVSLKKKTIPKSKTELRKMLSK